MLSNSKWRAPLLVSFLVFSACVLAAEQSDAPAASNPIPAPQVSLKVAQSPTDFLRVSGRRACGPHGLTYDPDHECCCCCNQCRDVCSVVSDRGYNCTYVCNQKLPCSGATCR